MTTMTTTMMTMVKFDKHYYYHYDDYLEDRQNLLVELDLDLKMECIVFLGLHL
jgi:hypothetical protein